MGILNVNLYNIVEKVKKKKILKSTSQGLIQISGPFGPTPSIDFRLKKSLDYTKIIFPSPLITSTQNQWVYWVLISIWSQKKFKKSFCHPHLWGPFNSRGLWGPTPNTDFRIKKKKNSRLYKNNFPVTSNYLQTKSMGILNLISIIS